MANIRFIGVGECDRSWEAQLKELDEGAITHEIMSEEVVGCSQVYVKFRPSRTDGLVLDPHGHIIGYFRLIEETAD